MCMDTDALRWLQQVADGTTVTEVSEVEAVTQSGVSRALARPEAQIGAPLLRRSGRTLRMTHAGAMFKPHLDALLHNLDDGIAAVNQLIDPDTGTVAADRRAVPAGRVPAHRDLRGRRPVQRPRLRRGRPGRGRRARAPRRVPRGGAGPGDLPGDPERGCGPGDLPGLVGRTPPAA